MKRITPKIIFGLMLYVTSTLLAHAILLETTLNDVVIGSQIYDVTFYEEDDQNTSFNDVFGTGSPTLTFTSLPEAYYAANAVYEALSATCFPCFDYSPAGEAGGANGFTLPFAFTPTDYTYLVVGYSDDTTGHQHIFGPFVMQRDESPYFPVSTISLQSEVPEPSTLALLIIGLAGFGIIRSRMKT